MKVFFTSLMEQPKDRLYGWSITSANYQLFREMEEMADTFMITVEFLEVIIWPELWNNPQILSDLDCSRQMEKERKKKYYTWLLEAKAMGIENDDPLYQEIQRIVEGTLVLSSEADLISIAPQSIDWIKKYRAIGKNTEIDEFLDILKRAPARSLLKKNLQIFLYALDKFCREGNILQPSEGNDTSHAFFKFAISFLNAIGVDIEVLIGKNDDEVFEDKAKEIAAKQQRQIKYLRTTLVSFKRRISP